MKRIVWQMVLTVVIVAWLGGAFCVPTALAQTPLVLSLDGNLYEVQRPTGPRLIVRQFGSYTAYVQAALQRGATLQEIGDLFADGMGTALEKTLLSHEIPPEDAKAVPGSKSLRYIADKKGRKFDRREVALALASLWDSGRSSPLSSHPCTASVTLQQVRDCTRLLAKFTTYYNIEAKERSHNLQLCADSINGYILGANETFSFNDTVGKRTAQRGYLAANSIENGGYVLSIGGGVCQVSSTLYNAALLAGLSCVGRHHSLPVQYVDPARDAMVSEWSDMTICNIPCTCLLGRKMGQSKCGCTASRRQRISTYVAKWPIAQTTETKTSRDTCWLIPRGIRWCAAVRTDFRHAWCGSRTDIAR